MWKRKRLHRRWTPARHRSRLARLLAREVGAHDRDTRTWAEERKIEARFSVAHEAGRRKTPGGVAERLSAMNLVHG